MSLSSAPSASVPASTSVSPHPKVLLAVTCASPEFWPLGVKTGAYFTEVLHPYLTFINHGYEVECISETGRTHIDATSIPYAELDAETRKAYHDKSHPIWSLLGDKLLNASTFSSSHSPSDYSYIYFCGGHGASVDFPTAVNLQSIASEIYANGGIIGAVCHGPAIFAGLKDKRTGELLIKGKKATGFSERGEKVMLAEGRMKERKMAIMRETIENAGGVWMEPSDVNTNPMSAYVVVDDRIVTGVNPASAADVAQKMVEMKQGGAMDGRPKKTFL